MLKYSKVVYSVKEIKFGVTFKSPRDFSLISNGIFIIPSLCRYFFVEILPVWKRWLDQTLG